MPVLATIGSLSISACWRLADVLFASECYPNPRRGAPVYAIHCQNGPWHFFGQLQWYPFRTAVWYRPRKWRLSRSLALSGIHPYEDVGPPYSRKNGVSVTRRVHYTFLSDWCICWWYLPWVYRFRAAKLSRNDHPHQPYRPNLGKVTAFSGGSLNHSSKCSWYIMYLADWASGRPALCPLSPTDPQVLLTWGPDRETTIPVPPVLGGTFGDTPPDVWKHTLHILRVHRRV